MEGLRHGDCLDEVVGMVTLADKSIDVAITDSPYSAYVHGKSRSGSQRRRADGMDDQRGATAISVPVDFGFEHITADQMTVVAGHFARVCRRWVLVFCDIESSHLWRDALVAAGLDYVRTLAWNKIDGAPQFTGDRPAVWGETIVVAHPPGRKRWNGGGKRGMYTFGVAKDSDKTGLDARTHATQKPVALMEALVSDFSDAGETVLDPFAGSGTTGVACRRLGRGFVGWEMNADVFAAATDRLAREKPLPPGYQTDPRQGTLL